MLLTVITLPIGYYTQRDGTVQNVNTFACAKCSLGRRNVFPANCVLGLEMWSFGDAHRRLLLTSKQTNKDDCFDLCYI